MNPKDQSALEVVGKFLRHHESETGVSTTVAVSGGRRMSVRIAKKLPDWVQLLRTLLRTVLRRFV